MKIWICCFVLCSALSTVAGATDITIGQSTPLTGANADLGKDIRNGALAYFEKVNAAGGVNGNKIKLVTLDDKNDTKLAAENTKRLLGENNAVALFGYASSTLSIPAMPLVKESRVPFFAPFTGAQSLREPFTREVFNIRASYFDETEYLVQKLVNTGMKNIAVFYQNDAYGQAGLAGVERAAKKMNITLIERVTVERNSIDVKAAVDKVLPKRPDAIIQISAYSSCAAYIKAMRKSGYLGQFYNVSFVGSQALSDTLGTDGPGVVISQVVPFPWHIATPVIAEYQKAMKKSGAKGFNFSSVEGFVAAKIFTEGVRRAGRDLTREKLIKALETINPSSFDVGGFDVTFSPTNHNGSKYVDMTAIIKDGKFLD